MKTKFTLLCLILTLGLAGCVGPFARDRGGYHGPAKYEQAFRDAINVAIAELQPLTDKELVFKWDKWPINVRFSPTVGQSGRGEKFIKYGDNIVCGYYHYGKIYVPDPVSWDVIVHETGHLVLDKNGIQDDDGNLHHNMFPDFFKKWSCR